jgi:MoaA/NifB/PqqE/SkfB family radical SAM enzyme
MGDRLERGLMISRDRAETILRNCRRLGAEYVTFLGGEPSLHPDLPSIIDDAWNLGYKQVMIDSNGLLFDRLTRVPPEKLYYMTISLDGASAETHERIRGLRTFDKTVENLKRLVGLGYRTRINCTICSFNVHEAEALLGLADSIGIDLVNFHTFSEEGCGSHKDWSLKPDEWIEFYEHLESVRDQYNASIWYPPTWATRSKLDRFAEEGFRGCLGCSLDRLSIFPDGRCYVCSVMFDEAAHFATMTDTGLVLNRVANEFDLFTSALLNASTPEASGCPAERVLESRGKAPTPDHLIPICRCWKSQA